MSPATDCVLAEGPTCSKTIICVHLVHCRYAQYQLREHGKGRIVTLEQHSGALVCSRGNPPEANR